MNAPKLIIALPALNESEQIGRVVESLPKQISGIGEIEILVVDDGSTDDTSPIAAKSGAAVVRHPRNRGVGAAFQTAVIEALKRKADILLTFDADGQFLPGEIPLILAPLLEGKADFVTGNRFAKNTGRPRHMSAVKYWGNRRMGRLISAFTGQKIEDAACGFRAYSRNALLHLNLMGNFTYTQEALLDLCHKGFTLAQIPIEVKYFPERKSRVAGNIMRYAKNTAMINFRFYRDYHPFRFFGAIGVLFTCFGMLAGSFLISHYLLSGAFTPYKAVGFLSAGFLLFGAAFFIVALFADMLDRIRLNQEKLLYYQKKREYGE